MRRVLVLVAGFVSLSACASPRAATANLPHPAEAPSCVAIAAAGPAAAAPAAPRSAPASSRPGPGAGPPQAFAAAPAAPPAGSPVAADLDWVTAEPVVITVDDERREGLGADFVRHQLDAIVLPGDPPPTGTATVTRVTRGIDASRRPPRAAAETVSVPVPKLRALLASIASARARVTRPPAIVVTASDTYRRLAIRIRTLDDARQVEVYTSGTNRSDEAWHLRSPRSPAAPQPELEPSELVRAMDDLAPYLTAAAPRVRE